MLFMIATGLNVLESLLSITMTKLLLCFKHMVVTYWLTFASFVVGFQVRIPAWAIFHHLLNFSISHPPKYKNTGFNFQTDK